MVTSTRLPQQLLRISEPVWRAAATSHAQSIRELLEPGLTSPDNVLNSGQYRQHRQQDEDKDKPEFSWTALDPKNPVYNFLIEYYGLKGMKGPKRLARWSPNPALLLLSGQKQQQCRIDEESLLEYETTRTNIDPQRLSGGILLEGASPDDVGSILHLKGAFPVEQGLLYSPAVSFSHFTKNDGKDYQKAAAPFLWYRSILAQTLQAEPILHCHGLHEWAMQYKPGDVEPPSAKYQSHLKLRVSQDCINSAVERRGISCTHVDALRFFAPAAGPLNHHGSKLQRTDQLRLEQPACVHAHMDLLKIALKLSPHIDSTLLQRTLLLSLQARRLDVAASPYDAREYGVGVVPVETPEGRAQYRKEQTALMHRAEPIRRELLQAYDLFLGMAFGIDMKDQQKEITYADPERFSQAEPGGLPWRRNLVAATESTS